MSVPYIFELDIISLGMHVNGSTHRSMLWNVTSIWNVFARAKCIFLLISFMWLLLLILHRYLMFNWVWCKCLLRDSDRIIFNISIHLRTHFLHTIYSTGIALLARLLPYIQLIWTIQGSVNSIKLISGALWSIRSSSFMLLVWILVIRDCFILMHKSWAIQGRSHLN